MCYNLIICNIIQYTAMVDFMESSIRLQTILSCSFRSFTNYIIVCCRICLYFLIQWPFQIFLSDISQPVSYDFHPSTLPTLFIRFIPIFHCDSLDPAKVFTVSWKERIFTNFVQDPSLIYARPIAQL